MGESGLSVGAIVGIAAASCLIIFSILVFLYLKGCLGGKENVDKGAVSFMFTVLNICAIPFCFTVVQDSKR